MAGAPETHPGSGSLLTRRQFAAGASGFAVAAALPALGAGPAAARSSTAAARSRRAARAAKPARAGTLRKSVALGPLYDTLLDDPTFGFTATAGDDARLFKATGTQWIRIWADWLHLQPNDPAHLNLRLLDVLDANISGAKRAGLSVILASSSYPLWANGTADLVGTTQAPLVYAGGAMRGAVNETAPWVTGGLPHPAPPCAQALATERAEIVSVANPVNDLRFRFPIAGPVCPGGVHGGGPLNCNWNLHPASAPAGADGSDWYNWILFLASRYGHPGKWKTVLGPLSSLAPAPSDPLHTWIDALEFVNEPTYSAGWPQAGPDGTLNTGSVLAVAQMFRTAQVIQQRDLGGGGPLMLGPASEGTTASPNPAQVSSAQDFTYALLSALPGNGFDMERASRFVWTHHNYDDFTFMRTGAPVHRHLTGPLPIRVDDTVNSAALVRALLVQFGWQGFVDERLDGAPPRLWLTEGGVRLDELPAQFRTPAQQRTEQARRLHYMWEMTRREQVRPEDPAHIGTGISMFTNWLFYQAVWSPPTGLLDPVTIGSAGMTGGAPRPAFQVWAAPPRGKLATEKVTSRPPRKPS